MGSLSQACWRMKKWAEGHEDNDKPNPPHSCRHPDCHRREDLQLAEVEGL